jgi:hypothetical protein
MACREGDGFVHIDLDLPAQLLQEAEPRRDAAACCGGGRYHEHALRHVHQAVDMRTARCVCDERLSTPCRSATAPIQTTQLNSPSHAHRPKGHQYTRPRKQRQATKSEPRPNIMHWCLFFHFLAPPGHWCSFVFSQFFSSACSSGTMPKHS